MKALNDQFLLVFFSTFSSNLIVFLLNYSCGAFQVVLVTAVVAGAHSHPQARLGQRARLTGASSSIMAWFVNGYLGKAKCGNAGVIVGLCPAVREAHHSKHIEKAELHTHTDTQSKGRYRIQ